MQLLAVLGLLLGNHRRNAQITQQLDIRFTQVALQRVDGGCYLQPRQSMVLRNYGFVNVNVNVEAVEKVVVNLVHVQMHLDVAQG
tara:strand:- start:44 stop:298 length:255 start_codon:yes stop_codon:yes gene_type:complete